MDHYDVIIIGSGAGGGTLAHALAPTGKRILILERGDYLAREKQNWDSVEIWGKQRVVRGDGKVGTVGKAIWTGFINSFPNLTNTVHTLAANDDGDVVVEADIEGTQQLPWGFITPAGKHYREPHLFLFHVGDDGLIDSITGYWDNASISSQLAHIEVD